MCERLVTNELSLVVILMDSLRCHEYKFTCKRLKCGGYLQTAYDILKRCEELPIEIAIFILNFTQVNVSDVLHIAAELLYMVFPPSSLPSKSCHHQRHFTPIDHQRRSTPPSSWLSAAFDPRGRMAETFGRAPDKIVVKT